MSDKLFSYQYPRREFLRRVLKYGAAAGLAVSGYGSLYERQHLVLRRVEVLLARLPEAFDGFTIAQLSDLHYQRVFSAGVIREAVQIVNRLRPDVVALTGDYVTVAPWRGIDPAGAAAAEPCAEILKQLQAAHGVFACLGNHDAFTNPERVSRAIASAGCQVLRNRSVPIEIDRQRLWIGGVEDVLSGDASLERTLAPVPRNEAVVLLAHEPDFADETARYPVDLQLSGHSHGGQVRIPFLWHTILPALSKKYPIGFRHVRQLALYTNVGLGTIHVPMRVLSPPEITLFTLRASETLSLR